MSDWESHLSEEEREGLRVARESRGWEICETKAGMPLDPNPGAKFRRTHTGRELEEKLYRPLAEARAEIKRLRGGEETSDV
jgi:hypothetical protein